jgi:hypothetical protein
VCPVGTYSVNNFVNKYVDLTMYGYFEQYV